MYSPAITSPDTSQTTDHFLVVNSLAYSWSTVHLIIQVQIDKRRVDEMCQKKCPSVEGSTDLYEAIGAGGVSDFLFI